MTVPNKIHCSGRMLWRMSGTLGPAKPSVTGGLFFGMFGRLFRKLLGNPPPHPPLRAISPVASAIMPMRHQRPHWNGLNMRCLVVSSAGEIASMALSFLGCKGDGTDGTDGITGW